ncbi:MAG: GTPase Era [Flavobacteriales bacterium]|nr:GTPase Era [Flavobacteriales bacterium]|tara:strand:- start:1413 stop:2297 length:885 start_codon:yes stop_codon:yes gene_type:complete
MEHKAGYVNIIGNPNVGKSTLMNALVGERLSIITSKAQTTRHRILGIVNNEEHQIIFSDTPGVMQPAYKLQENMMDFVHSAFQDADILVYMVETGEKGLKDEKLFERLKNTDLPVLLLLNKIDAVEQDFVKEQILFWKDLLPNAEIHPISALNKFNLDLVMSRIKALLPVSPPYFEKDALTDKSERFFVSETIREKILKYYKKEIPYSVEIEVEEFFDEEKIIKIRAIIFVARESQKGIIIGHKGRALKKVGTLARRDMETFFQKKIFLDLYVKVNKDWRNDDKQLKRFGYNNQ